MNQEEADQDVADEVSEEADRHATHAPVCSSNNERFQTLAAYKTTLK